MIKKVRNTHRRFKAYIYNPSVDIRDRSFILFSVTVLVALFLAIPAGIIMQEPLMATLSTLVGAIFFTILVIVSVVRGKIAQAKIVISLILIFIFLPAMFFSNGGVYGGTPIWLLLGTIYISLILNGRMKAVMLLLNLAVIVATWIVGYNFPDLITSYSRAGNYFDTLAGLLIVGGIIYILLSFQSNLFQKEEEHKNAQQLFEQTAMALAGAIDDNGKYTHGHSQRVAVYARKIAEHSGMNVRECEEVYYSALLHDVGKLGIPEPIINKEGKLTDEEYEIIKQHPVLGAKILHGIEEYPNLSVGAYYHHERYDGKGYPERLKGEDIPEIARIIAVADAYDAMTSKRGYRDAIPQQAVQEEIVKNSGTQFDPKYAKIMQYLIDMDTEFQMKEKNEGKELGGRPELACTEFRCEISDGILLSPKVKKISLRYSPTEIEVESGIPALIMYDSLDGRVHTLDREVREMCYYEYAEIWFDGRNSCKGARKIRVEDTSSHRSGGSVDTAGHMVYKIDAVRYKDHALVVIDNGIRSVRVIVALPDNTRFAYIALSGEYCNISNVSIKTSQEEISDGYITRIAEEVSFIDGPRGDIPNVQVDGYRTAASEGIPLRDRLKLTFHTKSLPFSRLIWHCAYVDVFSSADGRTGGEGYKEYALIRLDGESWEMGISTNELNVSIDDDFAGWDAWKEANKEGFDCTVEFRREGNRIITTTKNLGIALKNVTTIPEDEDKIFIALTGDQCAITNIRIEE